MGILNICLILIMLICLPMMAGMGLSYILRIRKRISCSLILGYLLTWTVIQLLGVPVTLMKGSFRLIVWVTIIVSVVMSIFGIVSFISTKNNDVKDTKEISMINKTKAYFSDRFTAVLLILMALFTLAVLYKIITTLHLDADDTRYVVTAVDILRTDTILQIDPTTGTGFTLLYGDFYKDLVSAWMVFLAYTGYVTGLSPAITAHTVMQVIIYILILCTYWMLSDVLFSGREVKEKRQSRIIFMYFVQLIIIFGYYSHRSSEAFILSRLWQGKAVVAGMGVPLIVLIYLYINKDVKKWSNWIILFMAVLSLCHMSSMGIVISAIMVGVFGLYTAVAKKSIRALVLSFLCAVPAGILFVISQMADFTKFIQ